VFYARGEIHLAALSSFLSNVIRFGYLVWRGSQGSLDGAAGLDAIAWGALAGLVVGVWGSCRYFTRKIDRHWVRKTWGESWRFSRWTTGALLTQWVSLEVYPLVVAGMISFAAAGAYRALVNLVAVVHVILRAMDTFITPVASRLFNNEGGKRLISMLKRAYLLGGIPIFIILAASLIFTAPLLNLLYGGEYLFMVDGIMWLVVFYLLWFTYWPIQSALKAIKHTRSLFNANLLGILCMFTLGILAVQNWGVKGAYLGQALNALITNIILWRAWIKFIREDFKSRNSL
jgi:O-antigen/teichoic acid export membrane protein